MLHRFFIIEGNFRSNETLFERNILLNDKDDIQANDRSRFKVIVVKNASPKNVHIHHVVINAAIARYSMVDGRAPRFTGRNPVDRLKSNEKKRTRRALKCNIQRARNYAEVVLTGWKWEK